MIQEKRQLDTQLLLSSTGLWGRASVSAVLYIAISDSAIVQNPISWPLPLSCPSSPTGEISTYINKQRFRDKLCVTLVSFSTQNRRNIIVDDLGGNWECYRGHSGRQMRVNRTQICRDSISICSAGHRVMCLLRQHLQRALAPVSAL